jgi:hypothetical protein
MITEELAQDSHQIRRSAKLGQDHRMRRASKPCSGGRSLGEERREIYAAR